METEFRQDTSELDVKREPTSLSQRLLERVRYGREKAHRLEVVRDAKARRQAREAAEAAKLRAQAEQRQADYAEKIQANSAQEAQFTQLRSDLEAAVTTNAEMSELVAQVVALWRQAMETTRRLQTLSAMKGEAWPMPDWVRTLNIWVSGLERGRSVAELLAPPMEEMREDVKLSELVDASGEKIFPEEEIKPVDAAKQADEKRLEIGAAQAADYEDVMAGDNKPELQPFSILGRVVARREEEQEEEQKVDDSVYYNTQTESLTSGEPAESSEADEEQETETVYYNTQEDEYNTQIDESDDKNEPESVYYNRQEEDITSGDEKNEDVTNNEQQSVARPEWLRAESETVLTDEQVWDLVSCDPELAEIWRRGTEYDQRNPRPIAALNAELVTYARGKARWLVTGHKGLEINSEIQPLAEQIARLLRVNERAERERLQTALASGKSDNSYDWQGQSVAINEQFLAEQRALDDLNHWLAPDRQAFSAQAKQLRQIWRAARG